MYVPVCCKNYARWGKTLSRSFVFRRKTFCSLAFIDFKGTLIEWDKMFGKYLVKLTLLENRNRKIETISTHYGTSLPHWVFSILIAGLILALFSYNKKVVIYKTEFKQAKNNRIQWNFFQKFSKFKIFHYIIFFFTCLTYN